MNMITKKHSKLQKLITISIIFILTCTITTSALNNKSIDSKNQISKYNYNLELIKSNSKAFILTTDYSSSSFSTIDLENPDIVDLDIASTNGDDEVRFYKGKVYVLNRYGFDLIEVFDSENDFEKIFEFSTGDGSNPQDIAFISEDKAYVSCYDKTDLLIVNPSSGEHLGSINLSEFSDDDGIPEMHKMVEFKFLGYSRVYLTIQRLDRNNWFEPTDKSYILEIDGDRDKVINAIQLTQVNPSTTLVIDGLHILIGEVGSWSDYDDGGIERIGIFSNEAEGFIVSEADVSGNIIDFEIYPKYTGLKGIILSYLDTRLGFMLLNRNLYTIVSDQSFNTSLISYNLKDKTATSLISTLGYQLSDLALNNDRGLLYISDRTTDADGIQIFDTKTNEKLTDIPINVGNYPPVHITFCEN